MIALDSVSSPSDVTVAVLSRLLDARYGNRRGDDDDDGDGDGPGVTDLENVDATGIRVASLRWSPLGRGAMSDVQVLDVEYLCSGGGGGSGANDDDELPSRFLVKFKREGIPLEDLFDVEGGFYSTIAEAAAEVGPSLEEELPFRLANAIAGGSSWLLLEYVSDVSTIDVVRGCPSELFDDLLFRMARMHASCWMGERGRNTESSATNDAANIASMLRRRAGRLSQTPGAGHSLPPADRQRMFEDGWPGVRGRLAPHFGSNGGELLDRLDEIVAWTSRRPRIEEVAGAVGGRKRSLVHGDFHVGNVLIPPPEPETCTWDGWVEENPAVPWLVDWSMAGVGDPCVDLVFFICVGAGAVPTDATRETAIEDTTEAMERILRQYHHNLICLPQTPVSLNWEEFLTCVRQCLLNQFVILVCYDSMCRGMADSMEDGRAYHDHFDRVNVRCVRMLLSDYGMPRDLDSRGGVADI